MFLPPHQRIVLLVTVIGLAAISSLNNVLSQLGTLTARDQAVRIGSVGAGGMLPNVSTPQQQVFGTDKAAFEEVVSVRGTIPDTEAGLGLRINLGSCAACRAHPALEAGDRTPLLDEVIGNERREFRLVHHPFASQ